MQRAILLQTDVTKRKAKLLKEFGEKALSLGNFLLQNRKSKRLMDLHKAMYSACKKTTLFNSQVICDIERSVVMSKGEVLKGITIKFNVPRNCKTFSTKSNFFVELGLYPRKRIAVAIRKNRNFQRYNDLVANGWACKTYGLTSNSQVVAFLSKEQAANNRNNMVGIDVNSKCFTASVLSPNGRVLKQAYFGKDIWTKRKKLMKRKSLLRSFADKGSNTAMRKLRKLKHSERNFVKNRVGEVVRDITNLALKYDADIGIEKLKRFSPKSKQFNRQVFRMPFYLFRKTLEARCFDKQISLKVVDAYHTSKWCSHCGAVAKKGHSPSNYALFKCGCGQVANSDRKASLAVAVKSLLERKPHIPKSAFFQLSSRRVPVNGLLRSDEGLDFGAVHPEPTPKESLAF